MVEFVFYHSGTLCMYVAGRNISIVIQLSNLPKNAEGGIIRQSFIFLFSGCFNTPDGERVAHYQMIAFSIAYMTISLIALLSSIPYWQMLLLVL